MNMFEEKRQHSANTCCRVWVGWIVYDSDYMLYICYIKQVVWALPELFGLPLTIVCFVYWWLTLYFNVAPGAAKSLPEPILPFGTDRVCRYSRRSFSFWLPCFGRFARRSRETVKARSSTTSTKVERFFLADSSWFHVVPCMWSVD